MAENDIYNSKKQYETSLRKLKDGSYLKPDKQIKHFIKNEANLKYFKILITELEYKDISYIRRVHYIKALRKTAAFTNKNLKDLSREDVKGIITKLNKTHKTLNTRKDYVNFNKAIWKIILPEKDAKGRVDDTIVPYAWRIKVHSDPSLRKDRIDKINDTEYIKIMRSLSNDTRIQLYFSLLFECLARPQELCYLNIGDVELRDNYARIRVRSHGKEGPKTLQVIEGYSYLSNWLNKHPYIDDKKSPLFITQGNNSNGERLTPKHANRILRFHLKKLGIKKPLTNYSFKRNGVTSRYKAGESAQNIQKIAGWTSTSQLKTYDLSEQEEFFMLELEQKGIIKSKDRKGIATFKLCSFCNNINPRSNDYCGNCKRQLDRKKILQEEKRKEQRIKELEQSIEKMKSEILKEFEKKLSKLEQKK